MKPMLKPNSRALLLAALIPLLSGCPASLPQSAPPIERAKIPPLPAEGRVSQVPIPSECSPTCLDGLTRARESWSDTLTPSASPALPASATPTDYSLPLGRKLP